MTKRVLIGENEFTITKLNAKEQMHCVRRIMPLLGSIPLITAAGAKFSEIRSKGQTPAADDTSEAQTNGLAPEPQESIASILASLAPMLQAVAALPDNDVDYVVGRCAMRCRILDGKGLAPIWSETGNAPMFASLTMYDLLRLSFEVLNYSVADFLSVALSGFGKSGSTQNMSPSQ